MNDYLSKEKAEELKKFSTAELVEELSHREGVVNTVMIPPYAKVDLKVEGPSTVLVVID